MSIGLPVARLVFVSVTLSPQAAQFANLKTLNIVGDTPGVIDQFERIRAYSAIGGVANDFGTSAPEYLAALEYFSQVPAPTQLFIGRWAKTAMPGRLVGGPLTGAQQAMANWTSIVTGGFYTLVNGVPVSVTGVNLSGAVNLNGVAAILQTAFLAAGAPGGSTVVWDATNTRFVFTSGTTGTTSTVSFLSASKASGSATFVGQPANNDTITLNGTVTTFVTGTPSAGQVQIGASLPATLVALLAFLQASVDTQLVKFTYSVVGSVLYLTAVATGTAGNSLTLAKTSTNITLSGGTLTGGAATDISAQLLGTSGTASWSTAGIAAESAVASIVAMDNLPQQFYALTFAAGTNNVDEADSDHLAVAAYCEASVAGGQPHVYGITTNEATALVANNSTDIGSNIQAGGYTRTFCSYSSQNQYLNASIFGRVLTVDYAGQNTALTAMWKQMPGVVAELLTVNQANALDGKRYNYVARFNNNTSILVGGFMSGPAYIDEIINLDNFANQLQTDIYSLLYTTPTKIPQTDPGVARITTTAEGTCQRFVVNGVFAPGQWNSNGFGSLNPGDQLPKGYYVYAQPVALQSQADRGARKSPTIQIACKEAGAIHTTIVSVLVNQ